MGISNVKQGDDMPYGEMRCSHGRGMYEPCSGCEGDGPVDYHRDVWVSPKGEMTDRWVHANREEEMRR